MAGSLGAAMLPAWLARHLPAGGAGMARLAAAELAAAGQLEEAMLGRGGFALGSAAFDDGEALDPSFTAAEEDAVAPPLHWGAPPAGARDLVLVVEDADAGPGEPSCHWLVWNLPPRAGRLLEGEAPERVGKNAFGNSEWLLPAPGAGSGRHHYVFQLFALDQPLGLMPGASRAQVLDEVGGHVLAMALLCATCASEDGADEEGGDYASEDHD